MTTKQELLDQIKVLEEKVNKLETPKPEEKTGVIYDKPEYGEPVYTLGQEGIVEEDTYSRAWNPEFLQGNLFYDQASAELESKRRAIRHRLAKFCRDAWDEAGSELDWDKGAQLKHHLIWRHEQGDFYSEPWWQRQYSDFILPYGVSETQLQEQFTTSELKLALTGSE